MASIQERVLADGKKSYKVTIRLKGYPTQTATFKRLTDARKWIQDTESAIRDRRYFKASEAKQRTTADLIDRYIETILPMKKSQHDQLRHLLWWKKEIGKFALSDVTPALIVEKRDRLLSGNRSSSTVNRYMASLGHPFSVAVREWGMINGNPLRKISKLKEPRGRTRFLSDDERNRLLSVCRKHSNPALYVAVILSISTGARSGEIMNLIWDQVDFDREVITLHETKNNERRLLPLKGYALKVLQAHFRLRNSNSLLVFPGKKNPNKPISLRTQFKKSLEEANITDFHWHDLRHTAASYLAMNGASPAEIAEILGHKTLSMVKRYAHLSEAHTSSVVESMNEKIFGNGYINKP